MLVRDSPLKKYTLQFCPRETWFDIEHFIDFIDSIQISNCFGVKNFDDFMSIFFCEQFFFLSNFFRYELRFWCDFDHLHLWSLLSILESVLDGLVEY